MHHMVLFFCGKYEFFSNNLTVLEPVVLYGRGARMDMQVEGRAARTRDPLMFEIQPHHLSDCHNPKRVLLLL